MSIDSFHNQLALWGPSTSGKTWLIHSFGKVLNNLNKTDKDFKYKINDIDGLPLSNDPPPNTPTQDLEDSIWYFERIPRKRSRSHSISSHSHVINLLDNRGESTIKLKDQITKTNIGDANFIMLMLDPTLLVEVSGKLQLGDQTTNDKYDSLIEDDEDRNSKFSYRKHEYLDMVRRLFSFINSSKKSPKRYVAICVTKIDLLGVRMRDPWSLIKMYFGQDMVDWIEDNRENFILETFGVSSVGYLNGSGGKPNFNISSGEILDINQWTPYNVEAPFFWLFEEIEKRRITENSTLVGRFLFKNERIKNYIPYDYSRR